MEALAALADPTRIRIVEELVAGPMTANEVVSLFSISQPSISRHLRILREAGLVSAEPVGRQRLYHLDPQPLAEIDVWLARFRQFWSDKLDALEIHMDEGN